MKHLMIGFRVSKENIEDSREELGDLWKYMDKDTLDALNCGVEGLYLFNLEIDTLICSSSLLEADVQKEVEESGMEYLSMSGCKPVDFVERVLKERRKRDSDLHPVAYDPTKAEELVLKKVSAPDDSTNTDPTVSVKNDRKDHKVRWELIPMEPINEIAKVYTAGAVKYGPDRWQNLDDGFNRYRGAACRHLFEYMQGNRYDEETKCMHLAQAAWNLIAMIWLDMHGKGLFPFEEQESDAEDKQRLEKLLREICEENKEHKAAFDRTLREVKTALLNNKKEKEESDEN